MTAPIPEASALAGVPPSDDGKPWHSLPVREALEELGVDLQQGLGQDEVAERRLRYGPNELVEGGLKSPWRILFEQFTDAMVIVLIVAALISIVVKDPRDAVVIGILKN